MRLGRFKIQKFSYPGKGDTPFPGPYPPQPRPFGPWRVSSPTDSYFFFLYNFENTANNIKSSFCFRHEVPENIDAEEVYAEHGSLDNDIQHHHCVRCVNTRT